VVTANPPYIPSAEVVTLPPHIRDHEPRLALDGGADGLSVIRRIVSSAPAHLRPGGALALEVGAGEADAVAALLRCGGFVEIERQRDYGRIERVVSGVLR
jgi:release factor glutamine methyltransferase